MYMYASRLPSQRAFCLFLMLVIVTALYIGVVVIYKDGKYELFQFRALFSNKDKSGTSSMDLQRLYTKDSHVTPTNDTSEVNMTCYVSADQKSANPLDDFTRYPCLPGLPTFVNTKQIQPTVKCVRSYCYPALNGFNTKPGTMSTKSCVSLRTPRGKTPICIYPPQTDIHVSGSLQRGGQWEGSLVANLARFIKASPGTEFLDIGCNIGAYTISMAHLGIKVTAIDPVLESLYLLSKSLVLGNLQNNVTLVWNAVANEHKLVKFRVGKRNIGGTHIVDVNSTTVLNDRGYTASTILLDDIIPLFRDKRVAVKMDIEESEYSALLGGGKFLDEIDVPVIQIEYLFHKKGKDGPRILSYLASKGFSPYRDIGKQRPLKSKAMHSWPTDLYYMRS